jgi:hypothetical protein
MHIYGKIIFTCICSAAVAKLFPEQIFGVILQRRYVVFPPNHLTHLGRMVTFVPGDSAEFM